MHGERPQVVDRGDVLRKQLDAARAGGATVGLVPTMGALHRGHVSLIERSAAERDVTAVTIFVNPLQFASGDDLDDYPRRLDRDLAVAANAGADLVFAPPVDEMFPGGRSATTVSVAGVSEGLEGASRPGHFDGVATVVAKLLNLAGPVRAYFGEKDYQQLAVLRRLAADLGFPVDIAGCPTVREPDGLACSSRNERLTAVERAAATVLVESLRAAAGAIAAGERDIGQVRTVMAATVAAEPLARLDYADVVDPDSLAPLDALGSGRDVRLLVAARVGATRLIDNLGVSVP